MARQSQSFRKDPSALLDYGFDWSVWLISGEIITTSTWTVPAGITKNSDSKGDTSTKIWLSGGTAGDEYILTNKIVTDGGRTTERSFNILMENR